MNGSDWFEGSRIRRSSSVGGESRRGKGLRVGEIIEEIGPVLFDGWGNGSGGVDERGRGDVGNDRICDEGLSVSDREGGKKGLTDNALRLGEEEGRGGRVGNRLLRVSSEEIDRVASLNGKDDGTGSLFEIECRNDFYSTGRRTEDGDDGDPEE